MLHVKVHVSDKDFQIRKPSIVIYMTESRIAINLFILPSCLSAFPPVQRLLLGNGFRTMALGAAYLLKRNPITYKITYPLLNRALGVNRKCKMPVTNITISSRYLVIWQNPYSEIYPHICCFIFNQISITANISQKHSSMTKLMYTQQSFEDKHKFGMSIHRIFCSVNHSYIYHNIIYTCMKIN